MAEVRHVTVDPGDGLRWRIVAVRVDGDVAVLLGGDRRAEGWWLVTLDGLRPAHHLFAADGYLHVAYVDEKLFGAVSGHPESVCAVTVALGELIDRPVAVEAGMS